MLNVRKYSDIRRNPLFAFGVCGGCKWQNLPYQLQTEFKQQEIIDNLQRIGKVELQNVAPIIGSPKTTYYRNKLEYTFCNKRFLTREEIANDQDINRTPAVGFHVPGLFDKVIDIEKCYLQAEPSNGVRNFIREYAIKHELSFMIYENRPDSYVPLSSAPLPREKLWSSSRLEKKIGRIEKAC